jgi:hypothetical protein
MAKTLRWRSRLPSDPPFDRHVAPGISCANTLAGILLRDGDRFTLDHDFAFADRAGSIDRFELTLTLDPRLAAAGGGRQSLFRDQSCARKEASC